MSTHWIHQEVDLASYRLNRAKAGWFRGAARKGDKNEMMRLLAEGVSVEARDSMGKTALMCACEYGSFETVKWLVGKGAMMDAHDQEMEKTAILWAVEGSCPEASVWLAQKMAKACPDALLRLDRYKNTAASLAYLQGDFESSRAILGIMYALFGYETTKKYHGDSEQFATMHADWEAGEMDKSAKRPVDDAQGSKRL